MGAEPELLASPPLRGRAENLRVDAFTVEVVLALQSAGVRPILLKGPAVAGWLYDDGSPRPYVDSDLLVSPQNHADAESSLRALGFELTLGDEDTPGWQLHAHEWRRADGARVDLHRTLIGAGETPQRIWEVLSAQTTLVRIGPLEVDALSLPARALHVALHAAQHGRDSPQRLEDLRRAVAKADLSAWREAAQLAERMGARAAFSGGLRLVTEGSRLAARLGLPADASREVALRSATPPRGALGLEELARARGMRSRVALVGRNFVPSPAFMRAWSPLARRGRVGLLAAYLWRPLAISLRAGPAAIAWVRAAASSRAGGRAR